MNYRGVSLFAITVVCAVPLLVRTQSQSQEPRSRYLFVWAGDEDRRDSDFLAVLDIARTSGSYGRVVASLPVGERALYAHHTEHELGPSNTLFANGFAANRTFLFDLHNPLHPIVMNRFGSVRGLSFLHSFARLPNGHVIATFQGHGADNTAPGGLAELDERGEVVRTASVDDSSVDRASLRPYSLAVVPALDRIVVGMTVMGIPEWSEARHTIEHDHTGNQVQVWRLSDLTLIKTITLGNPEGPNEPRVLSDNHTVLINTAACRLYRVTDLETTSPSLQLVHEATTRGCPTPVVVGHYWVQANAGARRVFSLDVSDLTRVHEVSSVPFDERQHPHWLATDGERIVVVNDVNGENRIWMLDLNQETGMLSLDGRFRNEGSVEPGFSFAIEKWPHGSTGSAVPHGTVFGR